MTRLRLRRPAYSWIASLALLLNALIPAIAHRADPLAIAVAGGGICTAASRSTNAPAIADPAAPQRDEGHRNGTCPCCLLDDGPLLLRARGPGVLAVDSATTVPDATAADEWIAAPAWPTAQSRAPPR